MAEPTEKAFDPVTTPEHYCQGSIQPLDYFEAQGWLPDHCCSCIVKYVTRYRYKAGLLDLRKARQYIDILIDYHERKGDLGASG